MFSPTNGAVHKGTNCSSPVGNFRRFAHKGSCGASSFNTVSNSLPHSISYGWRNQHTTRVKLQAEDPRAKVRCRTKKVTTQFNSP
eukprot:2250403-Amphidinium_carterae.1